MDNRIENIYRVALKYSGKILSEYFPTNSNFVKILQERGYPVKGKHKNTLSRKGNMVTVTGKEVPAFKKAQVTIACLAPNEDS